MKKNDSLDQAAAILRTTPNAESDTCSVIDFFAIRGADEGPMTLCAVTQYVRKRTLTVIDDMCAIPPDLVTHLLKHGFPLPRVHDDLTIIAPEDSGFGKVRNALKNDVFVVRFVDAGIEVEIPKGSVGVLHKNHDPLVETFRAHA